MFFLYEALVNKVGWEGDTLRFIASSLAVFGKLQEGEAEKKKLHSVLCLVGVNWFFTEMFRQDHTAKAGMKTLSLWYVLGVLWTYCYIANISK